MCWIRLHVVYTWHLANAHHIAVYGHVNNGSVNMVNSPIHWPRTGDASQKQTVFSFEKIKVFPKNNTSAIVKLIYYSLLMYNLAASHLPLQRQERFFLYLTQTKHLHAKHRIQPIRALHTWWRGLRTWESCFNAPPTT